MEATELRSKSIVFRLLLRIKGRIAQRAGLLTIAADSAILGVSSLVSALLQTALQVVTVRATGSAEFGVFVAATTYENIYEMIVTSRSGELALQAIGRYVVSGQNEHATDVAHHLEWRDLRVFSAAYLLYAAAALLAAPYVKIPVPLMLILGLALPAQAGYGASKAILIATGRVAAQARIDLVFWGISLAGGALGVAVAGIMGAATAQVVASVAKALIARHLSSQALRRTPLLPAVPSAHLLTAEDRSFSSAGHSIARNTANFVANQADVLLLAGARAYQVLAVYKIAKTLASIPVRGASPFWAALRPRMMATWVSADRKRFLRTIVPPSALLLVLLTVLLVPIYFIAPPAISLAYGQRYLAAAGPFVVLLIGTWLFQAMCGWFGFWVVIAEARVAGTLTYSLYLAGIGLGAVILGRDSAVAMAWAVTGSGILASLAAWMFMLRSPDYESALGTKDSLAGE